MERRGIVRILMKLMFPSEDISDGLENPFYDSSTAFHVERSEIKQSQAGLTFPSDNVPRGTLEPLPPLVLRVRSATLVRNRR